MFLSCEAGQISTPPIAAWIVVGIAEFREIDLLTTQLDEVLAGKRQDVFVVQRKPCLCSAVHRLATLPDKGSDEILLPKNLVHNGAEVVDFVVVNAHEDHAVLAQEVPRQEQPGIHHRQPFAVVAAVGLGVGGELDALAADLAGEAQVVGQPFLVVVRVDELVAGVVGRINVDHLHPPVVAALQELEDFQVVALNDEVFGGVRSGVSAERRMLLPLDGGALPRRRYGKRPRRPGFLRARQQRAAGERLDVFDGLGLARPRKAVSLRGVRGGLAQQLRELVEVQFALGERFREQFAQAGEAFRVHVAGSQGEFGVVSRGHRFAGRAATGPPSTEGARTQRALSRGTWKRLLREARQAAPGWARARSVLVTGLGKFPGFRDSP